MNMWTKKNITVSDSIGKYYTDVMKISSEKVKVVKNGINLDAFQPATKNELRKIRNSINYYGKEISIKETEDVLKRIKELRKLILEIIDLD